MYGRELHRGYMPYVCIYVFIHLHRLHVGEIHKLSAMELNELNGMAYAIHRKTIKSKGAGKGQKYAYTKVWSGRMTRNEYLGELARIDRKECGLFLCKVEYAELCADRWWDTPGYRATHLTAYRRKITELRKEYGLTSAEVSEFMRV